MLRLLVFVLPLGLDSFAVAAALGAGSTLTKRDRLRIPVLFMVFEGGMPLVGLVAGATIARSIGGAADYLAAAGLAGLGTWMLLSNDEENEEEKARGLTAARGLALIGLGVSISLDELAIGFSLGLVRLPVIPVIAAIAGQAFLAAQLGLYLGSRITDMLRGRTEQAAALALIALGIALTVERLAP